ncbi:hypothetical protein IAT38_001174 [Cryptococcus sp. DSM 104549]
MPDKHELQAHNAHASSSSGLSGPSSAAPAGDAGGADPGPSRSTHESRRPSHGGVDGVNRSRPDGLAVPTASHPHSHSRSGSASSPSRTPTSPTTELSALDTSVMTPHLDIANYPTQQLLRLLASLLQHIATSNDQLRAELADEEDEDGDGEHASGGGDGAERASSTGTARSRPLSRASARSNQPGTSPTTELFASDTFSPSSTSHGAHSAESSRSASSITDQTTYPLSTFPLFTASKASLSHPSALLVFHARHVPSISVEAYLLRILKYCPTTNEVFLGLLVYFDRMTKLGTPAGIGGEAAKVGKKGKGFAIDSFNVHRLVIAGVTVASKFFSDVFYTNSRYAKVGGLPPSELNSLELQFLLLNDFRLRISVDEMQRYGDRLLAYAEEAGEDIGTAGVTRRGSAPDGAGGGGVGEGSAGGAGAGVGRSGSLKSESGRDGRTGASAPAAGEAQGGVKLAGPGAGPSVEDAHAASVSTSTSAASTSQPPTGGPPSTLPTRATTSSVPRAPPSSGLTAPLPSASGVSSGADATAARPPASHTQSQPVPQASGGSSSHPPQQAASSSNAGVPPGATNPRLPSSVTPRGRERDVSTSIGGSGGGGAAGTGAGDGGVSSGLREWEWVRGGEDVMGHVGGRMTSPMRD